MNEIPDWRIILPILGQIRDEGVSINILRKLFIEKLNYEFADQELHIEYPENIKKKVLSTRIILEKNEFRVIFCIVNNLLKGIELPVVKSISRYHPANIIIFTNKESDEAHFINTKYVGKERDKKVKGVRRITIGKTDRLRTAAERLSKIYAPNDISTLALMTQHEEAFDVEIVSEEFYREFVGKYKDLRAIIQKVGKLKEEPADSLTQEIINRLLFLYFIQKKGWLNGDHKFLYNNFKSNKKQYYKNFLVPLFKKLSIKDFKYPGFENTPFLNGGLFEFQETEEKISIPNEAFKDIFDDLLERFNFTIREDTEFEEEVAIDPEMLGKIFEELILSIEAEKYKDIPDPRRASGSYYTPRFVVSFMVKQALLNYLTNELPEIPKEKLKSLIFDLFVDGIDNPRAIKEKLLDLKIVDPGVGSGAFSVDILSKLVNLIEILNKKLGKSEDRFKLRKKLIEDCIYGVDIQPRAVHLAQLRLWLSLIVDLEVEKVKDIPPLINLDFKIVKGDSLISELCGFKFDLKTPKTSDQKIIELIESYNDLKIKYAEAVTIPEKEQLKKKIDKIKSNIAIWHLEKMKKQHKEELKLIGAQGTLFEKTQKEIFDEAVNTEKTQQEIYAIDKEIKKVKIGKGIDAFNWHLDFFEVMGVKDGFDIVIANPPYGVVVDKEVSEDEFTLGSKDSYGVFAALGVNILKPGGTLCYIMSDTWQTIRTHYKLRKKLLEETETQYLISVPMKTFKAAVNTGIYLFRKSAINEEKDNFIIAADFHGLDIKKGDLESALDLIVDIELDEKCKDGYTTISDREMAIYAYRQKIIKKFSNLSFFIASPKLFQLMNDTTNVILGDPPVMEVNFNGKQLELVRLGDIAKVVVGLQTGKTKYYIRQLPKTKGSYKEVDLNLVLKEGELDRIRKDNKLRMDIIENGICTNLNHKTRKDRYFGGRYFISYDKGGASDIEEGWLPNYYVPTPYFIDWSERAVSKLKNDSSARFQNSVFYFKEGITFSHTGQYSPTFRVGAGGPFDVAGSSLFLNQNQNVETFIGILNSKICKYFLKAFINHSVNMSEDPIKQIPLILRSKNEEAEVISDQVAKIIQNQKQNPKYNYMTNEQLEIDKLVYKMYSLNEEDIKEVDNWYFRRYSKLSQVVEEKLKTKNRNKGG